MAFVTPIPFRGSAFSGTQARCPRSVKLTVPKRRLFLVQASASPQKGGMQRIEYIIRPDGRVEELVTGVKGQACEKLTEEIHEALGTVVSTEQTEDYFEKEVENTNTNINGQGTAGPYSSW